MTCWKGRVWTPGGEQGGFRGLCGSPPSKARLRTRKALASKVLLRAIPRSRSPFPWPGRRAVTASSPEASRARSQTEAS